MVRDDLDVARLSTGSVRRSSLSYIAQISDPHVFDEETPARWFEVAWASGTVFRYQEAYTAQVLDAMVRTINGFHHNYSVRPIDFALMSGDAVNNTQRNELDWFMQVMDGRRVHPDSGADDDPVPGDGSRLYGNDPSDPFVAEGLAMPWFANAGNHDLLPEGNFNTRAFVGDPTRDSARFAVAHELVPQDPAKALAVQWFVPHPRTFASARKKTSVADPQRRFLHGLSEFMEAHLQSTSKPYGHGFTKNNVKVKSGYYVVNPQGVNVPLRIIALDTSAKRGTQGLLSTKQLKRLKDDLAVAEGDNVLVLIASHHSSAHLLPPWSTRLRNVLNASPNVIAHIAGHSHRHNVRARRPHNASAGQGYWEIEAASIIDFPQQARLLEIVDRGDGTGELFATVIDYQIEPGSLIEDSRFYSLYGRQAPLALGLPGGGSDRSDRNVVLRFRIPAGVRARLASMPAKPVESLTFIPAGQPVP